MHTHFRFLSLFLSSLLAAAVWADNPYDNIRYNREPSFNYDDSKDKPWQEAKLEIPPPPRDRDLIEVHIDSVGDSFTVWLDTKTLSIGKDDRVIRYWLVLRSKTGANNAMYEGLRCKTKEYKTYAFASQKETGKIDEMKQPKWLPTKSVRGFQFRQELQEGYFCSFGVDKTRDEIVKVLEDANRGHYFGAPKPSGPAAFY
ncbi:MAG: CNP1-like family protein [Gammaproteobacteria bacterium]|nr:CNP1-like family protein [Gammaproteobacteria bacterium]MBU1655076.1 CNP1-like family protein [Gammaproteobacteria bacterium]MBU1961775.1 CNP1-like family protein [Gammaproteobacteria bacterium]